MIDRASATVNAGMHARCVMHKGGDDKKEKGMVIVITVGTMTRDPYSLLEPDNALVHQLQEQVTSRDSL